MRLVFTAKSLAALKRFGIAAAGAVAGVAAAAGAVTTVIGAIAVMVPAGGNLKLKRLLREPFFYAATPAARRD
jgi:NADPH-dependent curcumin reductase CurA